MAIIIFLQFIVHKKNVPHNVFIDQLRTKTSFFKKKHSLHLSIDPCCLGHYGVLDRISVLTFLLREKLGKRAP